MYAASQVAQNYLKQDQLFHLVMHLPCVLAAVSSAVQDILQQEFGRMSLLIPNGIDCDRFTPGPWQPSSSSSSAAAGGGGGSGAPNEAASNGVVNNAAAGVQEQAQGAAGAVAGSGEAAGAQVARTLTAAAAGADAPAGEEDHLAQGLQQQAALKADGGAAAAASTVLQELKHQHQQQVQELAEQPLDSPANPGSSQGSDGALRTLNSSQAAVDGASWRTAAAAAGGKKRILIVGNPALPLKGFPTAIAALAAVAAMLPISVRWVCQVLPTAATVPNLPLVDFELDTVVSPSQAELPGLYRGHDVFLFTSRCAEQKQDALCVYSSLHGCLDDVGLCPWLKAKQMARC